MSKPLIQVDNLAKNYGYHEIFTNISFVLREGEKVALVGPNGIGKSTVLKILANLETGDSGSVTWFRNRVSTAYVPQDPDFDISSSIRAVLLAEEARLSAAQGAASEAISRFGFTKSETKLPISALSGGQKTRLALGRAWLSRPELLLLDEPTNHLDQDGLQWLTEFVQTYPETVLVVSHDRYFLDSVVSRIIELSAERASEYTGSYSNYRDTKQAAYAQQVARYESEQRRIAKVEESIERQLAWFAKSHQAAGQHDFWRARSKRLAKQAKSRITRLEAMKQSAVERPKEEANVYLPGFADRASGRKVIQAQDLAHSFEELLFGPSNFTVFRGDKVGIIGENGSGKTTLLNLVLGRLTQTGGSLWVSPGAKIGYLDQELENLNRSNTVLEEVLTAFEQRTAETITRARTLLGCFLFGADDIIKPIVVLSTGERKRIALLKLLVSSYNLLILDEPTDHLDLPTREVLEEALVAYRGTLLLVSHDRYLMQRVCSKTLAFKGQQIISSGVDNDLADEIRVVKDERILLQVRLAKLDSELSGMTREDPNYSKVEQEYFEIAARLREIRQ